MLFAYTYVQHQMEKMQEFIDFIFYEVWCKAPIGLEFHPDLFKRKPDLHEVMSDFGFSGKAPERGKKFYKDIKAIYQLFASLSSREIGQFQLWYQGNNDIENVCANDLATQIVRYVDIPVAHKDLRDQLEAFFIDLYSKSLLDLATLKTKIGNINDHYKSFMRVNTTGKCPFCGVNDMLGVHHNPREAYDHYLPKALYPFNSINFRNLVPACHHCNSSYKTSQDPAYTPKDPARAVQRRRFFYPYAIAQHAIELQVSLHHADIEKLTPTDVGLQFGPPAISEEIDTWRDVYGIDERYRAKLLDGDGKSWLTEVLDEWRWKDESAGAEGRAPDQYLHDLDRHATRSPFTGANFLKKAFLNGCRELGLFDPVQNSG